MPHHQKGQTTHALILAILNRIHAIYTCINLHPYQGSSVILEGTNDIKRTKDYLTEGLSHIHNTGLAMYLVVESIAV